MNENKIKNNSREHKFETYGDKSDSFSFKDLFLKILKLFKNKNKKW
ncbi:hypothetical protein HOD20_07550 [archaeon]|jgi:hypothetical protein|nr:hypothetical protein [archaeon]MBT4352362.1 hypothetical protein [archaeon]MBT4646984.1 hypothetical protein [archaeon]MBT6822579.1 hypothetical protein [archaeon]MBT7392764.1 hypothetical protein [archaeon]